MIKKQLLEELIIIEAKRLFASRDSFIGNIFRILLLNEVSLQAVYEVLKSCTIAKEGEHLLSESLDCVNVLQIYNYNLQTKEHFYVSDEPVVVELPLASFINECCLIAPGQRIRAQILYESYKQWCLKKGVDSLNMMHFGKQMRIRYNVSRKRAGIFYEGLALKDKRNG